MCAGANRPMYLRRTDYKKLHQSYNNYNHFDDYNNHHLYNYNDHNDDIPSRNLRLLPI